MKTEIEAFHVTTVAKVEKYRQTGGILPPVRFWPNLFTAQRWKRRTGRTVIVKFLIDRACCHPLPDHRPAMWTNSIIRNWEIHNE